VTVFPDGNRGDESFFCWLWERPLIQFSVAKIACATVNAATVFGNEMKCKTYLAFLGFIAILLNRDCAQENCNAINKEATIPASRFGVLSEREI